MPEDAIGFEFFKDDQNPRLSIVNQAALDHASSRLSNEIAHLRAFDHLGNAIEAVQRAAQHKARLDPPDWNGNVPPDATDEGDFFLLG
ncbi:hypothetical protein [Ruegeria aquimaris]|uniref:Uncharacterized protein n=1 Tax=Ruegeria aquimaris TaxID=2984333 RepID=A0ABT3AK61_9RHOB|nr:hypothetical protein [Ruegeria sp. XHP0148]MCV2889064.1 hypothetical protein [Ruegeria sp. XHP0148]